MSELTGRIIAAAIDVHRALGPGLLESAYQACFCRELVLREVPFLRELELPVEYKGVGVECGYRLDMLVASSVVVEVKAVAGLDPIHDAQVLTYMRLGGGPIGLLINFNVPLLRDGVRRLILSRSNWRNVGTTASN